MIINDKYFETCIKQVTRNIFLTTEGYKIYSENSNFAVDGDKILAKYNPNNNKYYVHKILEKSSDIKYGVVFYNKNKKSYCIKPFSEYTTYYLDTTEHIINGTILEFTYSHYDKKRKVFVADIITEFDKNTDATSFKLMQYKKDFNEKVLNEILHYQQDKNRVDLTSDNFIAFDNDNDSINAYSFESTSYGCRIKITIPDISLIKASTYTNNEAYQRGFGVVLDKTYNILPNHLCDYITHSNNVLCLIINMNHLYETINYCFVKASINIKKRFNNIEEYLKEMDDKNSKYYTFLNNMCIACKTNKELLHNRLNDIANTLAGEFISQNNVPFIGFKDKKFDTTSRYATITDPLSSYISIMNNRIIHNIIMDKQIGIADIENDCDIMNALYRKSKDAEVWFVNKNNINKLKNTPILKGVVIKNDSNCSEILVNNDISGIIYKNIKIGKYVNVSLDIENSLDKIVFKII